MRFLKVAVPVVALVAFAARPAWAINPFGIYITEFCSDTGNNEHFEFVEVTNVSLVAVNMAGWSEDDSNATPHVTGHSLTGLGTLLPGQSGIFTEASPAAFRTYWGLPDSVKVVGPYTNDNLSTTADSITLFDAGGNLVDRLDYSALNGGTADMVSRTVPGNGLGLNNNALWVNSRVGDAYGSYAAPGKTLFALPGSPGYYSAPEPASLAVLGLGVLGLMGRRRRA